MLKGLDHTEIAHAVVDYFYNLKEGKISNFSNLVKWKEEGDYSREEIFELIKQVAISPEFEAIDRSMYDKETKNTVNTKMINAIYQHSKNGMPVVVDGMTPRTMIKKFAEETQGTYPITMGLAYLPLPHLIDRVTKRNNYAISSGDDTETRSYSQVIKQFIEHYKPATSQDKKDKKVIGHITTKGGRRIQQNSA